MAVITLVNKCPNPCTQFTLHSRRALPLREMGPRSLPVPGISRDIHVKFASTAAEWRQALQLVADQYQARGYDSTRCDYRFTSYHALPDTVVLVAKLENRVVATFSLVPDNSLLGLPLEDLYRAEIQALRREGRRLVELVSLADQGLSLREWLPVFTTMMRFGGQHQVRQKADTMVIAVNPRHSAFYTKILGFVPLGDRRAYPSVQNHPAEAFLLDPIILKRKALPMHERIFGKPLPGEAFLAPRMPAKLVRQFARHSSQTDPRLVEEILTYVEAYGSPRRW